MMPAKVHIMLLSWLLLSLTSAEELEVTSSSTAENQVQCVNDLIKWCKDMDQNNTVSMTYTNLISQSNSFQILCVRDHRGANCSKNGHLWFSCSPEGALAYKGRQLVEGSTEGADDDICNADDLLNGMDMGFNGMGMGFNQTAFDESMRRFREGMQIFEESMRKMQERLSAQFEGLGNRFFGEFWPFHRGGNPTIGYGDDDDYDDM